MSFIVGPITQRKVHRPFNRSPQLGHVRFEQRQNFLGLKNAVRLLPRNRLAKNPDVNELLHILTRGTRGDIQQSTDTRHRDEWRQEELVDERQDANGLRCRLDSVTVMLSQIDDFLPAKHRVTGLFGNTDGEKRQPFGPRTALADREQMIAVSAVVVLKSFGCKTLLAIIEVSRAAG